MVESLTKLGIRIQIFYCRTSLQSEIGASDQVSGSKDLFFAGDISMDTLCTGNLSTNYGASRVLVNICSVRAVHGVQNKPRTPKSDQVLDRRSFFRDKLGAFKQLSTNFLFGSDVPELGSETKVSDKFGSDVESQRKFGVRD
jgi:hypothetical protein